MAGFLGTSAVLQTDINLIIQLVTFLILIIGFVYKNKRKFKIHGTIMGIAVILHVLSFLLIMGPAFFNYRFFFTTALSSQGVQTTWIHVVAGTIAMILGIWLVGAWALNPSNVAACSRRKRIMDVTILLWLISLAFGIATYVIFYGVLGWG